YYSTFPIQNAAQPREWNYELPKVYMVAFLNFTMSDYATMPNFKHTVKLFDDDTQTVFYDKLVYYFLEMPKFIKDLDDLEDRKEYWLYIIKNINK
ncbi:Rpn family recombination-promoting nuclease/putative transposase, partial [Staphylococcus aureus]|uniref:Rpn family recombination-promoting nuclease/putative transposase n=1 Tax=Staphylococcus aureus TaxID=1280 RepID=UPI001EFEBBF4|nr:Rpn family recombination-promoting nuclease/putative transposase [Staphylococcus aureus]